MDMIKVRSSDIAEIGFDADEGLLRIHFNSGGKYEYEEVPERVWDAFRSAASYGRYFIDHIKRVYRARKVT